MNTFGGLDFPKFLPTYMWGEGERQQSDSHQRYSLFLSETPLNTEIHSDLR